MKNKSFGRSTNRPKVRKVLDCAKPLVLSVRDTFLQRRQRTGAIQDTDATLKGHTFKLSRLPQCLCVMVMFLAVEFVLVGQPLQITLQARIPKNAHSIALSGDTVVIGDVKNNLGGSESGAVYVFVRRGTNWVQQAQFKATPPYPGEWFGEAVAIDGDTIVVGASVDRSGTGAVWVFVRNGTNWSQQAYLKASNAERYDSFGDTVAISGNTIVVGARTEASDATGVNGDQNNNNASAAGAAYVFVREGTNWTQQAYLKASNAQGGDQFGDGVAISGDTILVSAVYEAGGARGVNGDEHDNSAIDSGAVYVFVRDGTNWSQQAYLKASNTEQYDYFGRGAIAVSGDTVIVGARFENSSATGINGDQDDNSAIDSGAAYVFVRNGTNWSQQAYLKASDTLAYAEFGSYGVTVTGNLAVVHGFNGGLYLFVRNNTNWSEQAKISAASLNDIGIIWPTLSGDTLIASGWGQDGNGAVYVFTGLELPPVQLAIEPSSRNVRVVWPLAASDFVLEQTSALASPPATTVWSTVAPPYQTNASHISITVPVSTESMFFRLRKL